ncbi:hypothetical protein JCM10207_000641, partial [Rhodosporidiobolus poonsookiae]
FNLGTLPSDPTRCFGAVVAQTLAVDGIIIGEVFFRNWYVIFDVSRNYIGLATPRRR